MVGGEEWQEKVYDREEWRRLLRTARNHRILFMTMDWLIENEHNTFASFFKLTSEHTVSHASTLWKFSKLWSDRKK